MGGVGGVWTGCCSRSVHDNLITKTPIGTISPVANARKLGSYVRDGYRLLLLRVVSNQRNEELWPKQPKVYLYLVRSHHAAYEPVSQEVA